MLNYIHQREGFNPRTRESATGVGKDKILPEKVSIHALVRVRLRRRCLSPQAHEVSIHALVRVRR